MALGNDKIIEIQLKLLDQISGNLSSTISAMKQAEKQANSLTKAEKELTTSEKDLSVQTKQTGDTFGSMGVKLIGVAAAYVGVTSVINKAEQALSFMIATGGEFEQSLANARAILQPTAEDFAALSQEAFTLGKTTVFTAAQAGDAFTELGKLGFNTSQILSAGNDVLALAAATQVDMARAATVSATVLNQFNLEAGRTGEVVDTIAKAMNISALDIDGFALSMKYVGPIAKQSGESIQSTSAALGVLADNGLQSMTAGTGMRRVLTMMADAGSKASKAIAQINPEAKTFADKLEALKKMGMDTTMAVEFFGVESQNAAMILADNIPKLREYGNALEWVDGKAKGYAQTVADIQIDTFQGDVKLLTSNLEALGIQFFESFGPQLREGVNLLNVEVNKLSVWASNNQSKLDDWGLAALKVFESVASAASLVVRGIETIGDGLTWLLVSDADRSSMDMLSRATENLGKLRTEKELAEKAVFNTASTLKKLGVDDIYGNTAMKKTIEASEEKKNKYVEESEAVDKLARSLKNEYAVLLDKQKVGVALSEQDMAKIKAFEKISPLIDRAVKDEISFNEAKKRIANETIVSRKTEGGGKVKTKGGDAPPDAVTGVLSSEETDKAGKAALESWERLLRERAQIGMTAETKAINDRQNYWNDLIETDRKGKGEHIAQLQKWKEEELTLSLSATPQMQDRFSMGNGRTISSQSLMMGMNSDIQGSGFKSQGETAMDDATFKRYMNSRDVDKSAAEMALKQEEFRYQDSLALKKEFHESSEQLTKDHEARESAIVRTEWEARGVVMAGFFGSMSQLMSAAGGKNKKAAEAAKHMATLEVMMNTAVAVSKVWGQTGIFGFAAQAAPIMAGAAQIAVIEGLHFAKGGIVPGQSYSGDNVQAKVNSGEMILNDWQQANLWGLANGRGGNSGNNNTFYYSPTFAAGTSNQQIAWTQREFRREVRAMIDDPTFATTQGALV